MLHLTLYVTVYGVRELAPAFLFLEAIYVLTQLVLPKHLLWNLPFTKCKFRKPFILILIQIGGGGRGTFLFSRKHAQDIHGEPSVNGQRCGKLGGASGALHSGS